MHEYQLQGHLCPYRDAGGLSASINNARPKSILKLRASATAHSRIGRMPFNWTDKLPSTSLSTLPGLSQIVVRHPVCYLAPPLFQNPSHLTCTKGKAKVKVFWQHLSLLPQIMFLIDSCGSSKAWGLKWKPGESHSTTVMGLSSSPPSPRPPLPSAINLPKRNSTTAGQFPHIPTETLCSEGYTSESH